MAPLIPLRRCQHFFLISDCDIYTETKVTETGGTDEGTRDRCRESVKESQVQWKWEEGRRNDHENMTAGRARGGWERRKEKTDGGRQGDAHLFAEALTVLILNEEVKLIRFISNGCL